MSNKEVSELGKTLEIYRKISIALNSFPCEEEISVKDLATRAGVHWNTARKALLFFHVMDPLVPKFHMYSDSRFCIVEKPSAIDAVEGIFESLEMRIVVKLMLRNAIEEKNAQKVEEFLSEEEKQVLQELITKGFVNSTEGCFYLSRRGQSLASLGIRRLIELGIELPWDKPVHKIGFVATEKTISNTGFVGPMTLTFRNAETWITPQRLYKAWQGQESYGSWQPSYDAESEILPKIKKVI